MTCWHTEQARLLSVPTATYAPIVRSFLSMDKSTREKTERKFDMLPTGKGRYGV